MPVEFLTKEKQASYGHYTSEPSPVQLARYFYLDDRDLSFVKQRRESHTQLGCALQLCTARFLGTFLTNPIDVPSNCIAYVAVQLGNIDPEQLPRYLERSETYWKHAREIKDFYGYHDFNDQPHNFRLVRWLYTRAWLSAERPSVLFDLATAWLVERKILLPGATVLARLVSRVRDRANKRVWNILSSLPDIRQREHLENLLTHPDDSRRTLLDHLRRSPTRVSVPSLVEALHRLETVRDLGTSQLDLSRVPASRVAVLARYATVATAHMLRRMPGQRRIATLLALAHVLEATAQDDAIHVLDQVISGIFLRAENAGKKERLRTLSEFDMAASRLGEACLVILDEQYAASEIRQTVFQRVPKEKLAQAVHLITQLAQSDKNHHYGQLLKSYRSVRQFLPALLETITFQGTGPGHHVVEALTFHKRLEEEKPKPNIQQAPRSVVPESWRSTVLDGEEKVDHQYYTFCVLKQLQDSLHHRDVFVAPSYRWADPRSKLLQGSAWDSVRPHVCRTLGHSVNAEAELTSLAKQLDEAYLRTIQNFPENAYVRIEQKAGRDTLVVTGLDKLEEPPSLVALQQEMDERLPRVDLPEVMMEMHNLTGFCNEFTHVSEGRSRVDALPMSACATLLSEACNIGLEPLAHPGVEALTRSRLLWVKQNYIRAETLLSANACLVDAQSKVPLAQTWGGGEVASADGLRFNVPVRTVNAGPNSKYFRVGRGVTYLNFTSDQFTGFHGIVIPGTLRDSLYILDGLLEHQTSLQPTELITDTAGYSDVVFGLFWLLGYQFSPRLADIGARRFWRIDPNADYEPLNNISRHRIKTQLIMDNWDDLLRVAGSLKLGTVSASELMRTLQTGSGASILAKAIGELGKINKTLYLLAYIDDEAYRRRILTQLNRGETRHSLARNTFHGQRGELRQRYREGQEDQLGALGLVVNIIVLWNTVYMDKALSHLRSTGYKTRTEDIVRLSPLRHKHINLMGRYNFDLTEELVGMRALREPTTIDEWGL